MSAREQLNRLADVFVEDIMSLSDEEILAEMRVLVDRAVLFSQVEDVNGKPRPRWEERLEYLVQDGLVGEALSLVRWLLVLKEGKPERVE